MPRYGINPPTKIVEGIETHACTFEPPTLAQMQFPSRLSPPSDELLNVEGPLPTPNEKDHFLVHWLPDGIVMEIDDILAGTQERTGSEVDIAIEAART